MPHRFIVAIAALFLLLAGACGGDGPGDAADGGPLADAPIAVGCEGAPAVGSLGLLREISAGLQIHPSAAFDGETIWIAYTANDRDNMSVFDTELMRLDCQGALLGEPIRATTTAGRSEIDPALAIGTESVALAWSSDTAGAENNLDIVVRAFDFDGTPRTAADITIEPTTAAGAPVVGNGFYPSLAALADGGFVLAGSNVLPGAPTFRAFANRLDDDGNLAGSLIELAPAGPETHSEVSAAAGESGAIWIAWTEAQAAGDVAMIARTSATGGETTPGSPLLPATLSSTPNVIAVGATRIAAASSEVGGERDVTIVATDGTRTATATIGTAGALDHTPVLAAIDGERGAVAYFRNLGGFRNQLVVVGYEIDLANASMAMTEPIEIAHDVPAPPYAPAIVFIRDGIFFLAWAEGNSPRFMLRGAFVRP